jgi:hypothetical protein
VSRTISIGAHEVVIDGVAINVLTREQYQASTSPYQTHIVVILDGFLRIKRSNGNAFMQTPLTTIGATPETIATRIGHWFLTNDGPVNEKLEDAVRFAATGF